MPSGAKRRKAAKKKKEKEASSSSTHSQQGDDGGGVNSPTSQEHHDDQHSSNEGDLEVEKREDIPSVQSVVSRGEPAGGADVNGASAVDSNVVEIDWEFKPEEDDPLSKTVESGKESHEDKSSSSSSSSSDDESFTFAKKVVVIESGEPEKDVLNPAVESGALAEPVKTDESSEVTLATDAASLVNLADLPEVTQVTDNFALATPTKKSYNEVEQTLPIVAPEITSNEVEEHVLDSNVPDLGLEENGKGKISELVTDVGSQSTKKEVSSTEVENSAVSSNVETFLSHEEEDKLLPPSSGPVNSSGNGTEHSKDYAGNESSDKQPLVAPAPRPVQTSWTGCCGIFELFTGSSR